MENSAISTFLKSCKKGMTKNLLCEGSPSFGLQGFDERGYLLHLKPSWEFEDYDEKTGESFEHEQMVVDFDEEFPIDNRPSEWVNDQIGMRDRRAVSLGDGDYNLAQYLIEYSYNDDAIVIGVIAREMPDDYEREEFTEEEKAAQDRTIRTLNAKLKEFHDANPSDSEWIKHGVTGWTGLGRSEGPIGLEPEQAQVKEDFDGDVTTDHSAFTQDDIKDENLRLAAKKLSEIAAKHDATVKLSGFEKRKDGYTIFDMRIEDKDKTLGVGFNMNHIMGVGYAVGEEMKKAGINGYIGGSYHGNHVNVMVSHHDPFLDEVKENKDTVTESCGPEANKLMEFVDDLGPESDAAMTIALACMQYMSEDDVKEMCEREGLFEDTDGPTDPEYKPRRFTNWVYGLAEEGVIPKRDLCLMCTRAMSDDEIAEMARMNELYGDEDEEDDQDDSDEFNSFEIRWVDAVADENGGWMQNETRHVDTINVAKEQGDDNLEQYAARKLADMGKISEEDIKAGKLVWKKEGEFFDLCDHEDNDRPLYTVVPSDEEIDEGIEKVTSEKDDETVQKVWEVLEPFKDNIRDAFYDGDKICIKYSRIGDGESVKWINDMEGAVKEALKASGQKWEFGHINDSEVCYIRKGGKWHDGGEFDKNGDGDTANPPELANV